MKKEKQTSRLPFKKIFFILILGLSLFFLLLVIFHFGLFFLYDGKIFPRVYLKEKSLGGHSYSTARQEIEGSLALFEQEKLILFSENFSIRVPLSSLGLKFNSEETLQSAYLVGRSGDIFKDFLDEIKALFFKMQVFPSFSIDQDLTSQIIETCAYKINKPVQNAELIIVDGDVLIKSDEEGKEVLVEDLREEINRSISRLETQVEIPVEIIKPEFKTAEVEEYIPEAQNILAKDLNLYYQDKSWPIKSEEIDEFLGFSFKRTADGLAFIPKIENKDFLLERLKNLASGINQPFKNAQLKEIQGKTVALTLPQEGQVLDLEKTIQRIDQYYQEGAKGDQVELMVIVQTPEILAKEGVINVSERVGIGESHFPIGAGQESRVHNIETAAAKLQDYLIEPGAIFSTNQALGEISYATGYWGGLALIGNRYVGAVGGGVCEVATVLFRVALDAGFEIVSRRPHSTVIYHYDWPQRGVDATIFPDTGLDFKFKNNSQYYVLLQTKVDPAKGILIIELYSEKKLREVTLSSSNIYNVTSPGKALYITDSSLKKGEKRLMEVPAEGCDVEVVRTIKEGDQTTSEVIKSHYSPWRAVYLVGE